MGKKPHPIGKFHFGRLRCRRDAMLASPLPRRKYWGNAETRSIPVGPGENPLSTIQKTSFPSHSPRFQPWVIGLSPIQKTSFPSHSPRFQPWVFGILSTIQKTSFPSYSPRFQPWVIGLYDMVGKWRPGHANTIPKNITPIT